MQRLLNCKNTRYVTNLSRYKQRYNFLNNQIGNVIFTKDRKNFYETLRFTDENKNRIRNIDKLNEKLKDTGLPFKIVYHKGSYPGRKRDTVWWTIEKIE